jgi:tRNA pseudouridine55 synthase
VKYGLLNLFKPSGPTSRDCVNRVAKCLGQSKIAHAGTLDPFAQGVLLILVGPAVRLMDETHLLDKEYVASFQIGQRSPSSDLETECERVPLPLEVDLDAIRGRLPRFIGRIQQVPSAYSAIRVDGKRSHKIARQGKPLQMPSRNVTIHELELLESDLPEMRLRIRCSTGTYIRTLGSDLAKSLGSDAVMTHLIRTRVGPFEAASAIALDALADPIADDHLRPAIEALTGWESWHVEDSLLRRILDGQRLSDEDVPRVSGGRLAVLDTRNILRALLKRLSDGTWRCEKGIAHWDVFP